MESAVSVIDGRRIPVPIGTRYDDTAAGDQNGTHSVATL
jgi:hypothetical protein